MAPCPGRDRAVQGLALKGDAGGVTTHGPARDRSRSRSRSPPPGEPAIGLGTRRTHAWTDHPRNGCRRRREGDRSGRQLGRCGRPPGTEASPNEGRAGTRVLDEPQQLETRRRPEVRGHRAPGSRALQRAPGTGVLIDRQRLGRLEGDLRAGCREIVSVITAVVKNRRQREAAVREGRHDHVGRDAPAECRACEAPNGQREHPVTPAWASDRSGEGPHGKNGTRACERRDRTASQ